MSYSTRRRKGDYRWIPECQGIYRLYHGEKVVYIGETKNIKRRIKQHEKEKSYWGSCDYKTAKGCRTISRKKIEKRAIRRNKPTRNIRNGC